MKIGKRKYNVGKIVEGHWILGLPDIESGEYRLEILPDNKRDGETLLNLINKNVEKDSTLMTDCWKSYNGLKDDGFNHLTVNHTYNFVDPETVAHTQNIESSWRSLKKRILRGGVRSEYLAEHLCELLWRKDIASRNIESFESLSDETANLTNFN